MDLTLACVKFRSSCTEFSHCSVGTAVLQSSIDAREEAFWNDMQVSDRDLEFVPLD